jgi:MFS family permease
MNAQPFDFERPDNSKVFYGWIVVMAGFALMVITNGVFYSYGVFFMPILTEFGWTRGLVSAVMTVLGFAYAATMPLSGFLADSYGFRPVLTALVALQALGFLLTSLVQNPWHLYLCSGLLVGCGAGAFWVLPVSIVSRWFVRRQGLALGITTAGIGVGIALIPIFVSYLISFHGWRSAYLIIGILVLATCIPASLLLRDPDETIVQAYDGGAADCENSAKSDSISHSFTLGEALSTRTFWALFILHVLCILGLGLTSVHLVPYALDAGVPELTAAGLLTIIGVSSIFGRLGSGAASDFLGVKPVLVSCLIMQVLAMLWLIKSREVWTLYVYSVLFGISYGGYIPLIPKLATHLFGSRYVGSIFGTLMVADGIGFGTAPWLAGYVFDISGSYHPSFLGAAAGISIGVVVVFLLRVPLRTDRTCAWSNGPSQT